MYSNQYDQNVVTFDPQGKLHQVDYATEAVKKGSVVVGLKSRKYAIIAALQRSASVLASPQQKLHKIDEHMGIGLSGIIADGRTLAQYMRDECLHHRYVFGAPMDTSRLVVQVSDKAQVFTQTWEKRPYGVGLLVAGFDKTGAHIFETIPSGVYLDFEAQAIGSRAQASKTYLQNHYETFPEAKLDDLILHAIKAVKASTPKNLTTSNVCVSVVGLDTPYYVVDEDVLGTFIDQLGQEEEEDDAKAPEVAESKEGDHMEMA